jgi:hypothetical protein
MMVGDFDGVTRLNIAEGRAAPALPERLLDSERESPHDV